MTMSLEFKKKDLIIFFAINRIVYENTAKLKNV